MSEEIRDELSEFEVQEDEVYRQRLEKFLRMKEETGYDPFKVERYPKRDSVADIRARFEGLPPDGSSEELVQTAGRLMSIRRHGRASFAHLEDCTGRIQLYFREDVLGEEPYGFFKRWVEAGDFVGLLGFPFRTRTGELTVMVREYQLLSKALRPLPEKWHGLRDVEIRYRRRYVDLMANPGVREVFRKRSALISAMRSFLEERGFVEVETPILSPIAGGANARPFVTYHNALGMNLYLRIATELYLKRLIVGMFEKVYEIGKNFRNEGIDSMHNPEFTAMECYWAYADYRDVMELTEQMIAHCALAVNGTLKTTYGGVELDFTPPFRRVGMAEAVREHLGVDFEKVHTSGEALEIARRFGALEGLPKEPSPLLVMSHLFEELVEDKLLSPTFVIGHPVEISPLAKRNPEDPRITNRFELYVMGKEVANAFSELNDPLDQRERFLDQLRKRQAGDEEAHAFDADFVMALEYGLPPTGGLGVGIDRLTMFLTDSRSIRDVILFPTMRPREG